MKSSLYQNLLLQCCGELFMYAAEIKFHPHEADVYEYYRPKLLTAFENFARMTEQKNITFAKCQEAKYALSAFIDEIILTSNLPGRLAWLAKPLQLDFFGEHLGGESFFKKLADIRQSGMEQMDLLEVYYVCIQLGFQGKYRLQGIEKLMALQNDLSAQISAGRHENSNKLFLSQKNRHNFLLLAGRKVPFWVIASVTILIMFSIFLGFSAAITRQTHHYLETLQGQ